MRFDIHISGGDVTELNSLAAALASSPLQSQTAVDTTPTSVTAATGDAAATAPAPALSDTGTADGT